MIDKDFQHKLENTLNNFREWPRGRNFQSCRLVQYCGVECIGGINIPPQEAEREVEGVFCEGFGVDWQEQNGRLYLVVWEPAGLEWTWAQVFAEQHLVDLSQFEPPVDSPTV